LPRLRGGGVGGGPRFRRGTLMRTPTSFQLFRFSVLSVLSVLGCERSPTASDHAQAKPSAEAPPSGSSAHARGHHEALPRRIAVSEEVVKNAGIKVTPVTKAVLAEALTLPGEVAADPDRLARISSPAQGRIEEVRFR